MPGPAVAAGRGHAAAEVHRPEVLSQLRGYDLPLRYLRHGAWQGYPGPVRRRCGHPRAAYGGGADRPGNRVRGRDGDLRVRSLHEVLLRHAEGCPRDGSRGGGPRGAHRGGGRVAFDPGLCIAHPLPRIQPTDLPLSGRTPRSQRLGASCRGDRAALRSETDGRGRGEGPRPLADRSRAG